MHKTRKKIYLRACYNRIWSWSPMPCEKHGPRASVTTKTSAFGLGFCLLSPSGHVFHTARETMMKSYTRLPPTSSRNSVLFATSEWEIKHWTASPSSFLRQYTHVNAVYTVLFLDSKSYYFCQNIGNLVSYKWRCHQTSSIRRIISKT